MNCSFKLVKNQVLVYGEDKAHHPTETLRVMGGDVKKILYQENVIEELQKIEKNIEAELNQLQSNYQQEEKIRQRIIRNLLFQCAGMSTLLALSNRENESPKHSLKKIFVNTSLLAGASILGPIYMSDEVAQCLDYQKRKFSLQRKLWVADHYMAFAQKQLTSYANDPLAITPAYGKIDSYHDIPQIVSQNLSFYEMHQKDLAAARVRCTIFPYVSIYFPKSADERTKLFSYLVDCDLKEKEKVKGKVKRKVKR